MEIVTSELGGVLLLAPKIFKDERGEFYEAFNQEVFNNLVGSDITFVQDNQSVSKKNVLRGFHFQCPPFEQGKLVRVVKGSVIDIVIDIRKDSDTYGELYCVELSAENQNLLWVPPGYAHGFYTLEDETVFLYKCTNPYHKMSEGDILWTDFASKLPDVIKNPLVSEKDAKATPFKLLNSPF